jgi:hypothetical protein
MAIFNVSNQLLQIDTGISRTYLYNSSTAFAPWRGLGENQVLGQRYIGVTNPTPLNPSGAPAIFMLVQYLATSATTTANLTTAGAPAPVYWTDETFTTVSGISTEGIGAGAIGLNFPAGYLMVNTVSLPTLTAAQLLGAMCLIQVAGLLQGAFLSTAGAQAIGASITPTAGAFTSTAIAAGTAVTNALGRQLTALASGLVDVLVNTDNF